MSMENYSDEEKKIINIYRYGVGAGIGIFTGAATVLAMKELPQIPLPDALPLLFGAVMGISFGFAGSSLGEALGKRTIDKGSRRT